MSSMHAVKLLLYLVTEKVVKVSHLYAWNGIVLSEPRRAYLRSETFTISKDSIEQKNINRNIFMEMNVIQQSFACKELGSKRAIRNRFVPIDVKVESTWVLQIVKLFLLFSLMTQADLLETEYAFS